MSCTCDIAADPNIVRLCEEHHVYKRGDKQLTSVTRVIKSMWPEKPDFSAAPEGVIGSARERGTEVDLWFSRWLNGELDGDIPADAMRQDSADLLVKLMKWWEKDPIDAKAQVILADDEIAGTADIVGPLTVVDLKTTYSLEPTYGLQLGGYCHLFEAARGYLPMECGILHLTKRFAEPKFIRYDVATVVSEFRVVLDFWRLVQSKSRVRL